MKQIFSTGVLVLFVVSLCPITGVAQESKAPGRTTGAQQPASSPDADAIRARSEEFVAAFNKGDAKAIAALWTEDGEYVDDQGHHFVGRQAIEKAYAEYFAANPDTKMKVQIDSLKLISPDAAIEDGRAVTDPPPPGPAGYSQYTVTHVKTDGKWLMASVRDQWIELPAARQCADDLAWLVGTWMAEEHGASVESVCSWVADNRFIERRYTTTLADGTKTSGIQLIGWNPDGNYVQSWDFSPDGGHAIGTWFPQEGGWSAEMRGVTGDGTLTSSVNLLRRLDDNAYVWKSVQRTAGGQALPDTDEVVLKRQSASR